MKHLLGINDLSVSEIDELITTASDIIDNPSKYAKSLDGKILATLFFEPSTRTRLSFESAFYSLGGNVIGFSSADSSSTAKGESLADTIRTVSNYSDIITMRHPLEGSASYASDFSNVPIVNAGDGGNQHPTQTLTDLLTITKTKGSLNNLTIAICGDLKYGRTVHSLIKAMIRYTGVKFILISPAELKIPDYIRTGYLIKNNIDFVETTELESALENADILYMTRIQKERFFDEAEYNRLKDSYILDNKKLLHAKSDMKILHPLPRVNEIAPEVDEDPRAVYHDQTLYGKYIRMALMLKLILSNTQKSEQIEVHNDITCTNIRCITSVEANAQHKFKLIDADKKLYRCTYCEAEHTQN